MFVYIGKNIIIQRLKEERIEMTNRTFAIPMVVLTAFFFLIVGSLTAADAPEKITMNSTVYKKHTKGLVEFSHKKHAERKDVACTECHHVYKDGKNVWKQGDAVQKCEACHSEAKQAKDDKTKMSKKEKIQKYHYDAIHTNCKNCHKKMIDKTSDMGKSLNKCTGCHPSKK
jgi:hypothetical protein